MKISQADGLIVVGIIVTSIAFNNSLLEEILF